MKPIGARASQWWMPWAAAGFFCGCLLWKFFRQTPFLWLALAGAAAGGALLFLRGRSAGAAALFVFFLLGLLRADAQRLLPAPEPGTYTVSAYVSGDVRKRDDGRLNFAVRGVNLNGEPADGMAYCTYYDEEEAAPELYDGALIAFTGRVNRFGERTGAVHTDFGSWARQRGYRFSLTGYDGLAVGNTRETAPVMDAAYRVREALEARLHHLMGERARLVMALLFGDRSGLSEEETKAFQTLGIAHVMSVSGLHVSLLAAMLWALLFRLRVPEKWGIVILSAVLLGYCALSGFSPSSLRAAIMAAILRWSRLRGRAYRPFSALGAAALILLVINPAQADAPGFILSFSAVGTIFLVNRPLSEWLCDRLPRFSYRAGSSFSARLHNALAEGQSGARRLLALTLSAQLGVLLPTALYFHRLPTYGILVNLLIVPLAGMVLTPLFAVTGALCAVPGVSWVLGAVSGLGAELLVWLVNLLSRLPYAVIRVGSPCVVLMLSADAALLSLFGHFHPSRARRWTVCAVCLITGITAQLMSTPPALRYIQTASGQSDAAVLMDGARTVVVDAGTDGWEVLDYLEAEARDVDALIITHLHMDHMGGVNTLLDSGIPIRHCYLPQHAKTQNADEQALAILSRLEEAGVPVTELSAGDTLSFETTSLRVLWPQNGAARAGASANVYSLAAALDFGGYTLLLAGDTTSTYDRYWAVPCDVLKAAHHGASDSTSAAFLQAAAPRFAMITCRSSARLPAQDTVDRLEKTGARVLRTDLCGDITLTVRDGRLTVTPFLTIAQEGIR